MLMHACFNGKQKDASIRLCLEPGIRKVLKKGKTDGKYKRKSNIRKSGTFCRPFLLNA